MSAICIILNRNNIYKELNFVTTLTYQTRKSKNNNMKYCLQCCLYRMNLYDSLVRNLNNRFSKFKNGMSYCMTMKL